MINLLEETLKALSSNGKTPEDVLWVGDHYYKTTWDDFASIANFNYDNGYGGNEIEDSLYIVGDNWWLERGEYDGSEWWEFKTTPKCESEWFTKLLSVDANWQGGLEWEKEDEST